jgi:predicted lipoprotein with Yx(FWY)xxD motif
LDAALVADLAGGVCGSVLGQQDAGYDAARAVHNGLIDREPALIVRYRTTNDIIAALALARRAGLGVANSSLGRIVVDNKGRTLYLFEKDKNRGSACYGRWAT